MKESTIYLTGSPGFKSAVVASIGHEWKSRTQDFSPYLLRLELPGGMTAKWFKNLVGEETLSEYNVMLFFNLHDESPSIATFIKLPIKRLVRYVAEATYRRVREIASNSTISYLLLGGR